MLELNTKSTQIRLDEFGRENTFSEVEDGVFYINLGKNVQSKFEEYIDVLSNAKVAFHFPLVFLITLKNSHKATKNSLINNLCKGFR